MKNLPQTNQQKKMEYKTKITENKIKLQLKFSIFQKEKKSLLETLASEKHNTLFY